MYNTDQIEHYLNYKILLRKTIYGDQDGIDFIKNKIITSLNASQAVYDQNHVSFRIQLNNPINDISLEVEKILKDTFDHFKFKYINDFGIDAYNEMYKDTMIKFLYDIIPFNKSSYLLKL